MANKSGLNNFLLISVLICLTLAIAVPTIIIAFNPGLLFPVILFPITGAMIAMSSYWKETISVFLGMAFIIVLLFSIYPSKFSKGKTNWIFMIAVVLFLIFVLFGLYFWR